MSTPAIGFVGIHAGGRAGQPTAQDEILARLFAAEGHHVRAASSREHQVPRTLEQVAAMVGWRDVDVLVVATFSGTSFLIAELAALLARRRRRPLVLFLHGGNLPAWAPAHAGRARRALRRADRLLAPSDYLADAFRSWGFDVGVIPNVVELGDHAFRRRSPLRPSLLWMRTFAEEYDPLLAVEAFARIVARTPDARLTMAGADQGLLAATRERATALGVADRIRFPGYLDAAAKAAALADHDVFLNTNRVDNMPVSVVEAAASGLVPVATRVGGIPALLADGRDALLVEAGDASAMADAVGRLLDDPDLAGRLSDGARETASRSDWPAVRRRWLEELEALGVG
ncbi:MAG: glycosyltransferase family 4 protein [Acidimicrobiales bacterium]